MASDLNERVGPTLRALARIEVTASQIETRDRLITFLDDAALMLPNDLRLAFSAGLALHEGVQCRFLEERMQWLAGRLQRDVRTARRRLDEAIRSVAASSGPRALDVGTPVRNAPPAA